jgi:hypothetical protein
MQEDSYAQYRDYLREGMRIEVGIPLSGGGIFRDWAIVSQSSGDELLAQISRDVLPANVRVDEGFILDVSISINKEIYTCSGIVIERMKGRLLRIRLFGRFTLRERRQFFRVNVKLRLRYAQIKDGNRREIERDWSHRREVDLMRFQGYDEFVIAAQSARYQPAMPLEWHEMVWGEGNVSGGGMLMPLPDPFSPEQLLAVEISVPLSPPRTVHCVAQVVHVLKPRTSGTQILFPAGFSFILLDERDRDLLFRFISGTQIALLRKISDSRDYSGLSPHPSAEQVDPRAILLRVLLALVSLILVFLLTRYLIQYQQNSPNEIGQSYGNALKQYRHE